jgi:hypothetical protein
MSSTPRNRIAQPTLAPGATDDTTQPGATV